MYLFFYLFFFYLYCTQVAGGTLTGDSSWPQAEQRFELVAPQLNIIIIIIIFIIIIIIIIIIICIVIIVSIIISLLILVSENILKDTSGF